MTNFRIKWIQRPRQFKHSSPIRSKNHIPHMKRIADFNKYCRRPRTYSLKLNWWSEHSAPVFIDKQEIDIIISIHYFRLAIIKTKNMSSLLLRANSPRKDIPCDVNAIKTIISTPLCVNSRELITSSVWTFNTIRPDVVWAADFFPLTCFETSIRF